MNFLARFFGGVTERLVAVVFAVSAAQFPVYFLAYSNTLAGARMEAQSRYEELQREAAQLQLEIEAFVRRHEDNPDSVFQASGRIHRTTLEHYQRYSAMAQALQEAPLWRRPLVLAQNFDPELHAATHFEPGLPLTPEAGAYALIGVLLAWLLTGTTGAVLRRAAV
ncbi:MAG TPA: DUF2937 family protein [Solimonas sp.]|nr:DUF2937 family protein [Solimonas sp.]